MNIVDTYNRTGYLDIPGDKVVKSKDEYFLFWYNSPDTLCLRQQIEEIGSSSIGKKRYMLIYGDKYMDIEIPNENFGTEYEYPDNNSVKMIYVICFRNTYMVLLCGLKL